MGARKPQYTYAICLGQLEPFVTSNSISHAWTQAMRLQGYATVQQMKDSGYRCRNIKIEYLPKTAHQRDMERRGY